MDIEGGLLPTSEFKTAEGSGLQGLLVGDFWKWAYSDLVSNISRGTLAEFIVAALLGAIDHARDPWAAYDITTSVGLRVEVKSSGYKQAWHQAKPSRLSFSIGRAAVFDQTRNDYEESPPRRPSDVYVFCVLGTETLEVIDPLDLSTWTFFVVPTTVLDDQMGAQKTASLPTIERLASPVAAASLAAAVESASATREA